MSCHGFHILSENILSFCVNSWVGGLGGVAVRVVASNL